LRTFEARERDSARVACSSFLDFSEIARHDARVYFASAASEMDDGLKQRTLAFYDADERRWDTLRRFVSPTSEDGSPPLALRHLDYYVVTYSRREKVEYLVVDAMGRRKSFSVHGEYKANLKAYSKEQFDPFCRGEKVEMRGGTIRTAWRQMNFFAWMMSPETQVLAYALTPGTTAKILSSYRLHAKEAAGERRKRGRGAAGGEGAGAAEKSCGTRWIERVVVRFPAASLVMRTYENENENVEASGPSESDVVGDEPGGDEGEPKRKKRLVLPRSEMLELPVGLEHDPRLRDHEGDGDAQHRDDPDF